jgi:hypothetical protein
MKILRWGVLVIMLHLLFAGLNTSTSAATDRNLRFEETAEKTRTDSPHHYLYFPLVGNSEQVIASLQFGISVADGGEYDGDEIWFNWHYNQCESASYWPMIYSGRRKLEVPENCSGKPLLLLNEPEFRIQANVTPARAAEIIYALRDWQGPLYCCGNYYTQHQTSDYHLHPQGINYIWEVIRQYQKQYNEPLPLTGIHLHVYNWSGSYPESQYLERDTLRIWRRLADLHNWEIVVSEVGAIPRGREREEAAAEVAAALPKVLDIVIEELAPTHIFWFVREHTDDLNHHNNSLEFNWSPLSLYQGEELTPVGEAWYEYIERANSPQAPSPP